ncbi:MAG TPA: hypothetical protein VM290_10525 [Gaiellaceae bacterium]|nr:hypothetical protein [Gaiellaceae bacterium]
MLHGLVSLERAAALDDTAAAVALRLRTFRDALRQSLQETM